MNELDKLYAKLGRKQDLIENQDAAYAGLLDVTASIVKGDIDPNRVLVNLTDRTWSVVPAGQRPPSPATINGLPVCVVAPSESEADVLRQQLATVEAAARALDAEVVRLKQENADLAAKAAPAAG